MGFMDSLKKFFKGEEEQIEMPPEGMEGAEAGAGQVTDKIMVRVENLTGVNDVERIEGLLKQGNILFLKVVDLQKKDLGQFKQTVQMLKRRCIQFGWDIVGVEDGYIVLTPKFAKIMR
jgi:SepF-like predicted cell division protein (DUF552 family)